MASQALLKALMAGRPKQARLLLQLGADANCQDELGQTPLIRALQIQDPRLRASFLRLLLQAGAHVGLSDVSRRNALMWACRVATCDDVMLLLQATGVDFDVNARDNRGQTALWAAADAGQADVVRVLVEVLLRGHQPLDVGDHQGVTPAMRAAIRGHVDCLNLIIRQDDPFLAENVDFQALSNRKNVIQLAEVVSQNNQSNQLQEEETAPSSSRIAKSSAAPIIRIISANGQHVLTLPQTPEPSESLLHPDDADRHRPDAADARKHSEALGGIRKHSATREWCSTPSLSSHRQNTSPSLNLDVSGISAVTTSTPATPDGRFSRLLRCSAQPRRAFSCRSQSRKTLSRSGKSQEDCVIYRERTLAPENHHEVWTDLETFNPLAHAATGTVNSKGGRVRKGIVIRIDDGRVNSPDMRQAGIFTSTPDPLPPPGTREADVRVLPWPWPCESSVRESLPHLFSMFAPFYSQSFRKAAAPLPGAPSLSKTLRIIHHAREKAEEKAREQAERERLENAALEEVENNPARRGSSWSRLRGAVNKLTPGVKPTSPAARMGGGAARQELNHFA